MKTIILEITKIKGKKAIDYVINGGIGGAKVLAKQNELVLPVKIIGFTCSARDYSSNFWVTDNETHLNLPETKDDVISFVFVTL